MKTCTKCSETKPKTEFGKDVSSRNGLRSSCKVCNAAYCAAYRAANPAYKATYYAANADKVRAPSSAWAKANPDKVRAANTAYRAANTEKVRATKAAYRSANPEAKRIYDHNRIARKREAGGKLSKCLADKLFKLQRGKCACCKQPLGTDYHLDHIMPIALGGTNTDDNIQLLRATCNRQKHAAHPVDFMQRRGFLC